MFIRKAKLEDAAAIARVHVDSWRTTYKGLIADEFLARLSYERREAAWHTTLSPPHGHSFVFVAETEGGEIVGFVSGGPEREGDKVYPGEIYALYLLQSYQKQGIGRLLVRASGQALQAQGFPAMLVWVLADNLSRRFYEAMGGKYLREKQIQIGEQQLTEVAYGYKLPNPY